MRKIFYNKFFSRLSIALIISFLISRFSMLGNYSFAFALMFFAALYILLAWLSYLRLDGLNFFGKRENNNNSKMVDFRFWYKKKGVYNMDKDDDMEIEEDIPEDKYARITIFAYLACALILFIISQILFRQL